MKRGRVPFEGRSAQEFRVERIVHRAVDEERRAAGRARRGWRGMVEEIGNRGLRRLHHQNKLRAPRPRGLKRRRKTRVPALGIEHIERDADRADSAARSGRGRAAGFPFSRAVGVHAPALRGVVDPKIEPALIRRDVERFQHGWHCLSVLRVGRLRVRRLRVAAPAAFSSPAFAYGAIPAQSSTFPSIRIFDGGSNEISP